MWRLEPGLSIMKRAAVGVLVVFLLVVLSVSVSAYEDVIGVSVGPAGLEGPGRLTWLYCGDRLVPGVLVVYALPPGFSVEGVAVSEQWAPAGPVHMDSAYIGVRLPRGVVALHSSPCRPYLVQVGVWRGVTFVSVVAPLYRGGEKLERMTIRVEYERVSPAAPLDAWTYRIVSSIATYKPVAWASLAPRPYQAGIIVLTRDYLLAGVEEWAKLKEKQGFRVKIITVDEVCRNVTGAPLRDLRYYIREAVKSVYEENPGVYRYLVIVGDASGRYWSTPVYSCDQLEPWEVPPAYFYNPTGTWDSSTSHTGPYVPSDVYYATFDGNWDADGDGKLGEYPDDVKAYDPYPELIYARIPARTPQEAYEALRLLTLNAPTGDYMVLAGSVLQYYNESGDGLVAQGDSMLEGLYLNLLRFRPWLEPRKLYEHYPVETLITSPSDINGNLTHGGMLLLLGSLKGMVTIFAHGDVSCVWRKIWVSDNGDGVPESNEIVWKPFLCASDAPSVKPQLLYAVSACLTAYYDNPTRTSLGEAMVLAGSGYLGWSRVTFGPLLQPQDQFDPEKWCCSDLLIYLLYKYMLGVNRVARIGDAVVQALIEYVAREPLNESGYNGNVSRRVFFGLTLLADPTRIAYSRPTTFNPEKLVLPTRSYGEAPVAIQLASIEGEPIRNAPVYIYKLLGGYQVQLLYTVYTGSYGYAKFALPASTTELAYLAYYPGNDTPPYPTEPTSALITVNASIAPWLRVEPSYISIGKPVRIVTCGYPAFEPLDVYVAGVWVTRLYSNATGCVNTTIALPLTIYPGTYTLSVVDTRDPAFRAETSIVVTHNPVLATEKSVAEILARLQGVVYMLNHIAQTLNELAARLDRLAGMVAELNTTTGNTAREILELVKELKTGIDFSSRALNETLRTLGLLGQRSAMVAANVEQVRLALNRLNQTVAHIAALASTLDSRLANLDSYTRSVIHGDLVELKRRAQELEKRISLVQSTLSIISSNITSLSAELGGRLDAFNAKLEKVAALLETINSTLETLNGRVESNARMLEKLEKGVTALSDKLASMLSEVLSKLARVEGEVKQVKAGVSSLSSDVMLRLDRLDKSVQMVRERLEELGTVGFETLVTSAAALAAIAGATALILTRRG